jgi:hypothetical protein
MLTGKQQRRSLEKTDLSPDMPIILICLTTPLQNEPVFVYCLRNAQNRGNYCPTLIFSVSCADPEDDADGELFAVSCYNEKIGEGHRR